MKKLGRYRLTELLGQGGMGDVYAAVVDGETGMPNRVCVKVMNKALSGNERAVELFLREARLAARLTHPNIVPIIELGRESGTYFIAMEMLEGLPWHDLAQRNWRHGKTLPLEVIIHACAEAAEALEYAHTLTDRDGKNLGMVHRDVSPDNLFLTTDGSTKVLDFGIAKAVSSDATRLTEKGELRGKLPYMPPEQVKTEDVDGAADVWALGITIFYLATAQRPFDRDTPLAIMNAVLKEPAISASSMNPAVPRALADVIARCLQKAPQDRWPSARAARDALLALLPGPLDVRRARDLLAFSLSLEKGDRRPLSAPPSAPTYAWDKPPPTSKPALSSQATVTVAVPTPDSSPTPSSSSSVSLPSAPAPAGAPAQAQAFASSQARPEDRLPSRNIAPAPPPPRVEKTTISAPLLTADESAESLIDADSSEEESDEDEAGDFVDDARTVAEMPALSLGRRDVDPPTDAHDLDSLPPVPSPSVPSESTVAMPMDISMLRDPPRPGHGSENSAENTSRNTVDELTSGETAVAPDALPPQRQRPAPTAPTSTTLFSSLMAVVKPLPVWAFGVAAFALTVIVAIVVVTVHHVLSG